MPKKVKFETKESKNKKLRKEIKSQKTEKANRRLISGILKNRYIDNLQTLSKISNEMENLSRELNIKLNLSKKPQNIYDIHQSKNIFKYHPNIKNNSFNLYKNNNNQPNLNHSIKNKNNKFFSNEFIEQKNYLNTESNNSRNIRTFYGSFSNNKKKNSINNFKLNSLELCGSRVNSLENSIKPTNLNHFENQKNLREEQNIIPMIYHQPPSISKNNKINFAGPFRQTLTKPNFFSNSYKNNTNFIKRKNRLTYYKYLPHDLGEIKRAINILLTEE